MYEMRLISSVLFLMTEKMISPRDRTTRLAMNVKLFLRLLSLS